MAALFIGTLLFGTTAQAARPTVTTDAATSITGTGATLNGTVNPQNNNTTVTFDYGLTTGYGTTVNAMPNTIPSGSGNTAVSAALTGLSCNTTYHFRVSGVNSRGQTSNGGDLSFTTLACGLGGVINTYYPGVGSVTAGTTSVTLGAATGSSTQISTGDMLLIIQMQDATMDASNTAAYGSVSSSNAGKYEYAVAANSVPLSGGTLKISCGLLNSYTDASASGSSGQHRYQVIRVPVYASNSLSSTLTAQAWNGSTGGVLALDVTGTLDLNSATVSVDGLGFRGGAGRNETSGSGSSTDFVTAVGDLANGSKGEGIAGTPYYVLTPPGTATSTGIDGYPNGSFARGAPANGGGGGTDIDPPANDQNSGGGGGGNGGTGGIGGIGWCPSFNTAGPTYGCGLSSLISATNPDGSTGGIGGSPVAGLGTTRLTLGGGGGAGTTNNNTGAYGAPSSSGTPGGGIIMVRAGSLSGTATFSASGSDGDQTVANDGGGGAGAGGTIMVSAASGMSGLTLQANGGKGGSTLVPGLRVPNTTATPHGPGGGGGGGFIITSGAPAATSVAGGSNGVSYNGGSTTPFTDATGSYGSTPGSSGSVNAGLVTAAIPGTALGSTACPATVDHFAIAIGGSSGSTCAPKSITITAQNASNGTVTNYTGLISITAAPAHGDWSAGTPAPGGTLSPGTADSGVASYQFVAGDNGVLPLLLSDQHADASLTIAVADSSLPSTLSTSSAISFSDNAFVITNDPVQVAGRPQAMNVAMWQKDPSTGVCQISPYYTGSRNLKAWLTVDSYDPGGASPTIGALSLPNAVPGGNNLSLTFPAGSAANFNLNTSDVGKYALNLRDDSGTFATGGNVINGSSSVITTRPFALVVSNIRQGATLNPANSVPTGSVFARAGSNFQATVGAYLWSSVADTNSDGIPDGSATLAQITANGTTPSYKWTTTLSGGIPFTPATPLDTPAGTGVAGSFGSVLSGTCPGGSPNCFTSGIATPTNLNYSEVGSYTLSAGATSFLNTSGVDLNSANGTALVFDNSSPTPLRSGVVGRFIPDHFGVSVNPIQNRTDLAACASGCGNFTYMGEQMDAVFTLTALAAGGTTTQNYSTANGFAKLDPTAVANPLGLTALDDNGTTRTPLNPLDLPALATGSFAGGVAAVVAPIAITRGATAVGPYTVVNIGISPVDSDGVTTIYDIDTVNATAGTNNHTKVGTTAVRYGRIKLSNAHGSELLDLPINAMVQYWDGTGYTTSSTDSVSSFATTSPSLTFANCQPLPPSTAPLPYCPPSALPSPASMMFANGTGQFTLKAPGANNTGSVDMSISIPGYLPSNVARATFGVYSNNSNFIYQREQY
jgi:Family of unknown function (DUF6701)